jgi:hypothetical protein
VRGTQFVGRCSGQIRSGQGDRGSERVTDGAASRQHQYGQGRHQTQAWPQRQCWQSQDPDPLSHSALPRTTPHNVQAQHTHQSAMTCLLATIKWQPESVATAPLHTTYACKQNLRSIVLLSPCQASMSAPRILAAAEKAVRSCRGKGHGEGGAQALRVNPSTGCCSSRSMGSCMEAGNVATSAAACRAQVSSTQQPPLHSGSAMLSGCSPTLLSPQHMWLHVACSCQRDLGFSH